MNRLDPRAVARVSGPAWEGVRQQFFDLSAHLLDTSPECQSELTTVYVKYLANASTVNGVFAVIWLKKSTELVLGLALPPECSPQELGEAPKGMKYRGLTRYLTLHPGDSIPEDITEWVRLSYENVSGKR